MEESSPLDRIHSEGRGMSASTQEYDMNTKQLFAGAAVATALALASSAYAGQLGGIGSLGGNLGGNLRGMGSMGSMRRTVSMARGTKSPCPRPQIRATARPIKPATREPPPPRQAAAPPIR